MENIRYNKVVVDAPNIVVHPFGDVHLGHEMCDLEYFTQRLEAVPKKENHRILLMGDLLDVGIKTSIGGSVYDNSMRVDSATSYLIKLLKPWANQIDGAVTGNHEWRLYKDCGIDITEMICDSLNIPYLKHSGLVTYSLNKRAYNVNLFHGKGGGGIENALRNVKAMSGKVLADIYLMGHVHGVAKTKRQYKTPDSRNAKVVESTQHFVLTGHCLNYDDSYADQMNLEINSKGFPYFVLRGDIPQKHIEVFE